MVGKIRVTVWNEYRHEKKSPSTLRPDRSHIPLQNLRNLHREGPLPRGVSRPTVLWGPDAPC